MLFYISSSHEIDFTHVGSAFRILFSNIFNSFLFPNCHFTNTPCYQLLYSDLQTSLHIGACGIQLFYSFGQCRKGVHTILSKLNRQFYNSLVSFLFYTALVSKIYQDATQTYLAKVHSLTSLYSQAKLEEVTSGTKMLGIQLLHHKWHVAYSSFAISFFFPFQHLCGKQHYKSKCACLSADCDAMNGLITATVRGCNQRVFHITNWKLT